jgi:cytochrome P450
MTTNKVDDDFDHLDPDFPGHILETYREFRDECPIKRSEKHGGFWILTRHEDVTAAIKDWETFSSAAGVTLPPFGNIVPAIPSESDEPRHADYRGVLRPFLSPRAVAHHESYVRGLVTKAINEFIEDGRCEAVGQIARQVPALVTARLFGFDSESKALQCMDWLSTMFDSHDDPAAQGAAAIAITDELRAMVEDRRRNPRDNDVFTAILNAAPALGSFTEEECLGLVFTSVVGAVDTTVSAASHMLKLLAQHPDARARLIAEPELASTAIEEVLRMEPPAQQAARTVKRECTYEGQTLNSGDRVMLLWGASNRDDRVFANPDEFVVDRQYNPHLTFGGGVHKCLGMHMARLELRVILEEVLRRLPDYTFDGTPPDPLLKGGHMWSLPYLNLVFAPGIKEEVVLPAWTP